MEIKTLRLPDSDRGLPLNRGHSAVTESSGGFIEEPMVAFLGASLQALLS